MKDKTSWRRWATIFRPDPRQEVESELAFHVEARIQEYIDRGMTPDAARRAASERLGDLTRVREECTDMLKAERRADDRRTGLNLSWLDVKLGLRMLKRYPGLSLVSVIGMSVAIAIGAGYFGVINAMLSSALPFEGGERVVSIRNENLVGSDGEYSFDFLTWREMKSLEHVGAYYDGGYNLITADGRTEVVPVAAMTTAGFRLAGAQAMMGRTLLPEDERPGAPAVMVIGRSEWQRRFHGAPDVLGQTVRLGDAVYTIVGVMPSDFRFPIRHQYWIPLRFDAASYEPGAGPPIDVFGRLAEGFTLDQARAEVQQIGRRLSEVHKETHEHMRPQVIPYTAAHVGVDSPDRQLLIRIIQSLIGLVLVIVAVNISILTYARTATRMGEIATRSALGASRRRIIAQLFVEALVLACTAAAIGLTLAGVGLGFANSFAHESVGAPFWLNLQLSPAVILYVVGLTLLAAAIVGVIPALKATGRKLGDLRQFSSRGAGMRLGGTWTALIVIQVGIAVAALPHALNFAEQSVRAGIQKPGAAADGLVRSQMIMNRSSWSAADDEQAEEKFRERRIAAMQEMMRRLEREPGVAAATFSLRFPGEAFWASIERDSSALRPGDRVGLSTKVRYNKVALNFFDVFRAPVLAGRGFTSADTLSGSTSVIVDEVFARQIGANVASVIGQRIRYPAVEEGAAPSRWYEIVGVVSAFNGDLSHSSLFDLHDPHVFHAAPPGFADAPSLVVRIGSGNPAAFASRLDDMAASVDANLRVEEAESVIQSFQGGKKPYWGLAIGVIAVMISVLMLSAAGIYAMMSFTVERRRREIGIRAALGADARRVLAGIFGRASAQLGAGVLAGLLITAIVETGMPGEQLGTRAIFILPAVVALIVSIGLLAALGPARRGLSVQPTDALRAE